MVEYTFIGMVAAGERLIRQGHEADAAGFTMHEVKRLRSLADSCYQTVTVFKPSVGQASRPQPLNYV